MTGPSMRVGLIGAGRMGAPMAVNLARAGIPVTVWTRSGALPPDLAAAGVRHERDLVELGRQVPVALTVLPDLPDVRHVCDAPGGLLSDAAPGTVVVVMGTVSPPGLRLWAETVTARGFDVVDAPMSGGVEGARAGTLSVMVGGDPDVVARLMPVFDVVGRTVRHLGPIGSGQLAKACNQAVVAASLTALAESVTLARHAGVDVSALLDLLAGGLAGSTVLQDKRARYLADDWAPGGAAAFQHKDLGFVLESAREHAVAMPVAALVDQLFGAMRWTGRGDLDHSAVVQVIELLSSPRPST